MTNLMTRTELKARIRYELKRNRSITPKTALSEVEGPAKELLGRMGKNEDKEDALYQTLLLAAFWVCEGCSRRPQFTDRMRDIAKAIKTKEEGVDAVTLAMIWGLLQALSEGTPANGGYESFYLDLLPFKGLGLATQCIVKYGKTLKKKIEGFSLEPCLLNDYFEGWALCVRANLEGRSPFTVNLEGLVRPHVVKQVAEKAIQKSPLSRENEVVAWCHVYNRAVHNIKVLTEAFPGCPFPRLEHLFLQYRRSPEEILAEVPGHQLGELADWLRSIGVFEEEAEKDPSRVPDTLAAMWAEMCLRRDLEDSEADVAEMVVGETHIVPEARPFRMSLRREGKLVTYEPLGLPPEPLREEGSLF